MREIPVIPENAPFQLEQRIWLNGFLAALSSSPDSKLTRNLFPRMAALTSKI
jgi:hypothetical protein